MSIGTEGAGGGTGKDRYAELAALLRARREELGLSRRALAETTGLSYPYIAQLEGGYRAPSVSSARRLADALRLPVEDIVHAADETSPSSPPALDSAERAWMPNPSYALSIDRGPAGPAVPELQAYADEEADDDAPRPSRPPRAPAWAAPAPAVSEAPLPAAEPPPRVAPPPASAPSLPPPPRRRRFFDREPPAMPRTAEPAGRGADEAAQAIAAILRGLPVEDRLDALSFAQREVMAEIVDEQVRRTSHDPGGPGR